MKSKYSQANSNCVNVEHVILPDGEFIRVTDTKGKTGPLAELLFDRDEWVAFIRGAQDDQFDWDAIIASQGLPKPRRVAGSPVAPDAGRRTPENLAYVNGRHAEKNGWAPFTIASFSRRFSHDLNDPRTTALFEAFQTGRRAEAHDSAMAEGH